jgi:hypothetical protein
MRGLWCVSVFGLFSSCAQPPTAEIDIAEARVERAQREGAAEYAPEILIEAEEALSRARALQSDSSRYRDAIRAAAEACLRSDDAREKAIQEKSKIARSADRCLREIRALLEESRSLGAERTASENLETYRTRAERIGSTLEAGSVSEAFAEAETLKQELLVWLRDLEASRSL